MSELLFAVSHHFLLKVFVSGLERAQRKNFLCLECLELCRISMVEEDERKGES